MPPVKDEQIPTRPVNTSSQIQQIFSEIQSQLPSVNFDNDDDHNDDDNDDTDEDLLQTNIPENTDAFLESLSTNNTHSFQIFHPRNEPSQQPPSVETQMRVSPNLFDNTSHCQLSPPKPSILSMDLFNTIDFDKLASIAAHRDLPQATTQSRTFNRPRPNNQRNPPSQEQPTSNVKSRDDRQILERLTQQANKFSTSDRLPITRDSNPFQNLELALSSTGTFGENLDRHGRRIRIPESERKTIYIDLRNSTVQKQEKSSQDSQPVNMIKPITHQIQSSDSESDDEQNDGMLWFEKRQQARKQQQQSQS